MKDEQKGVNYWKRGALLGLALFIAFSFLLAIFNSSIFFSKMSGFLGRFFSSLFMPVEAGLAIKNLFIKVMLTFGVSVQSAPSLAVVLKPISIILIILKQVVSYCVAGAIVGLIVGKIKSKNQG